MPIAEVLPRWHAGAIPVTITIDDISEDVRDELASRAEARGQSLEEFLLGELERMASRPSVGEPKLSAGELVERVRARKAISESRVTTESILRERDADRK